MVRSDPCSKCQTLTEIVSNNKVISSQCHTLNHGCCLYALLALHQSGDSAVSPLALPLHHEDQTLHDNSNDSNMLHILAWWEFQDAGTTLTSRICSTTPCLTRSNSSCIAESTSTSQTCISHPLHDCVVRSDPSCTASKRCHGMQSGQLSSTKYRAAMHENTMLYAKVVL